MSALQVSTYNQAYALFSRLLNSPPSTDKKQLQRQYHHLATQFHPDRNGGDPEKTEIFKAVENAYKLLDTVTTVRRQSSAVFIQLMADLRAARTIADALVQLCKSLPNDDLRHKSLWEEFCGHGVKVGQAIQVNALQSRDQLPPSGNNFEIISRFGQEYWDNLSWMKDDRSASCIDILRGYRNIQVNACLSYCHQLDPSAYDQVKIRYEANPFSSSADKARLLTESILAQKSELSKGPRYKLYQGFRVRVIRDGGQNSRIELPNGDRIKVPNWELS